MTSREPRPPLASRLKFHLFDHYWWMGGLLAAATAAWAWSAWPLRSEERELLVPILGLIFSWFFFIQRQRLQELRLTKELFTEFNDRYNDLNEHLQKIYAKGEGARLEDDEKEKLVDYFNLCAEEFFFLRRGYIHPTIWRSWKRGMAHYTQVPRIRAFWEEELRLNSYYGFPLDELP